MPSVSSLSRAYLEVRRIERTRMFLGFLWFMCWFTLGHIRFPRSRKKDTLNITLPWSLGRDDRVRHDRDFVSDYAICKRRAWKTVTDHPTGISCYMRVGTLFPRDNDLPSWFFKKNLIIVMIGIVFWSPLIQPLKLDLGPNKWINETSEYTSTERIMNTYHKWPWQYKWFIRIRANAQYFECGFEWIIRTNNWTQFEVKCIFFWDFEY